MTSPARATSQRALRRDAALNRARIVTAARAVFAERGFDVPLADVAAAAGVGIATLSRHYDRTQLVQAVAEERLAEHLRVADDALALPPAAGVASYMQALCERRLVDRSLCHTFTLRIPDSDEVDRLRTALRRRQLDLIAAGQRAGALRAGITPQDLLLILEAVQGVMDSTAGDAAWRRIFAMLMASLSPAASSTPLPAPPSPEELMATGSGPSRGRRVGPVSAAP